MDVPHPMDQVRDAMLAQLVQQLPTEMLQWRDRTAIEADMAEMLDEQLDWCNNESFAELRATRIGIGEPRDYFQRILDVNGCQLLCGIRFADLDPDRAYVALIAWTDPALDLTAAARAAMDAHRVFKPLAARVFRDGVASPPPADGCSARGDQVLCAESLQTITSAPPPPNYERTTLVEADVDEAADFVARGYEALAERSPEIAPHVAPEDRDELAGCREDGRLAWWRVAGRTAGLIAVRREQWLGLDGFLMVEEVIAPEFAGKRTASAAQYRMAEALAEEAPHRALFGTIDFCNTPSRRTAARVGRREIAAWWYLSP